MRLLLGLTAWLVLTTSAFGQTPQPYGPFPNGMRVIVGSNGILVRNTPNYGLCGLPLPGHQCTNADALPPNTYGVIQPDPPVLDAGGAWYWTRVLFEGGQNGWVSAVPPYLNMLSPPQMNAGVNFLLISDYVGPALTGATCILDGQGKPAILTLQPGTSGQTGTLGCTVNNPGTGNHKAVIQAVNGAGTAASPEFQYVVTTVVVQQPPTMPGNLRIASAPATAVTGVGPTAKPAK